MIDDSYTKALLHMDGADTSTSFIDEIGKVWTKRNHAQIVTAQSVFGGSCALFDGTDDSIDSPDHADWRLDGGSNSNQWTIDARIRFNGVPSTTYPCICGQLTNDSNKWGLYYDGPDKYWMFLVYSGGTNIINPTWSWTPTTATWYHIALVKQGTTGYKLAINGTFIGSTQTNTNVIPDFSGVMSIGTCSGDYWKGWIDEFRISKGVARWTGNFIPPAKAYSGTYVPQIVCL